MQQRFARLMRWWWRWTLPPGSTATVAARERQRKARLLSVGVLAAILLGLPLLLNAIARQLWESVAVLLAFEGIHVVAALLNRRGRVALGSWVYIFGYLATAGLGLIAFTPAQGVTVLWGWVQLLIPSIFAGLFLPFWTPLLFGVVDSLLYCAIATATPASRAALALLPWSMRTSLFVYVFVMMGAVSIICTVSSYTVERAVAEADRTQEVEEAHAALASAHADLARAYARLEDLATTDPITGLLNHRAMTERLAVEADRARRTGTPLAVIFADLDHFKQVNDVWGHHIGDLALQHLAAIVRANVRTVDLVARYGGEEFVIALPDQPLAQARQLAERLRRLVAETPVVIEATIQFDITVSLGVAFFPADGATIDDVLIAADAAMYRAKRTGRNRVCITGEDDAAIEAA
jgi:diguanylate cyclase (GGDEF)-like protein